jgi:hypothetical protein
MTTKKATNIEQIDFMIQLIQLEAGTRLTCKAMFAKWSNTLFLNLRILTIVSNIRWIILDPVDEGIPNSDWLEFYADNLTNLVVSL